MNIIRAVRVTARRSNSRPSFELTGNKIHLYNWGYAPYAYHVDWHGPTAVDQTIDSETKLLSDLTKSSTGWYKHNEQKKVADVCAEYCNYSEDSYQKAKKMVRSDFGAVRTDPPIDYVPTEPTPQEESAFSWSEYRTEFHPWFKSWLFRTLVYMVQGVESNMDLAQEKMYFREVQEQFHITKYKVPGDHLMTKSQYEKNLHRYYLSIQSKSEMPPICVPRPEIQSNFDHKSQLFEHCDGSDLVMTDVSPAHSHETRQIVMRERKSGTLRHCTWKERDRRLQAFYPTKHRSIDLPIYIDPDHAEIDHVLDTFLSNFGSKGAMQVMEAAVSYYDLNDERYCRLRHILNTKLTASGQLDHFYATRHGGQFIFHMLESGHAAEYIEHLTTARSGPSRVQELRTMFILLELIELSEGDLLTLSEEAIKATLDRIFVKKYFECSAAEEMAGREDGLFPLLSEFLTYDNRYMLNSYPDYKRFLRYRN